MVLLLSPLYLHNNKDNLLHNINAKNMINFEFKNFLTKNWSVNNDALKLGKETIALQNIEWAKLTRPTSGNGLIEIRANGKTHHLLFVRKLTAEGVQAFHHIDQKTKNVASGMRRSLKSIEDEISKIPQSFKVFTQKEVDGLPEIISSDEEIKAITSGMLDWKSWLILCTPRRVLFIDKGPIARRQVIEIGINKINSISYKNGIILGEISITDGATTRRMKNIPKDGVQFFVDAVNKQINNSSTPSKKALSLEVDISIADEIMKFKNLLDAGIISKSEFDKKKNELLG